MHLKDAIQLSQIKKLFEPESVAVIGASSNPSKIGHKILNNIVSSGYKGQIYPINPHGGELLGLPVYESVKDVPDKVDLGIIVVPARLVYSVIQECADKKIPFLIIITSGFSEVGNREEEEKIVNLARKNNIRILGPNVFGIFVANTKLNATFGPPKVTQSGALGIAMIGKAAAEGMGLSAVISVGNKADINEAELLEYLKDDPNTEVILLYIEGVRDGQALVKTLKGVTKKKHVVVLKSGKSKRGAIAAASHTGSLAGSDEIFQGIADQTGVIRAEGVNEAFNFVRFLSNTTLPKGKNNVIVTNGGGLGVLCADACEKYKVPLMDDQDVLKKLTGK